MTCEEFERIGWNAERDATLSAEERSAALAHAAHCPGCAAREDSWLAAKRELRGLAAATEAAQTPARVEMRLRQEFRARHRARRVRRGALTLTWGLAAAAVVLVAFAWFNSRTAQRDLQSQGNSQANSQPATNLPESTESANAGDSTEALIADSNGDFTPLPGSAFVDSDDASIVRVRMQRGALSALGLPVNEERAGEWIQVDLLVTDDGQPQGVRLSP